ncbi:MAG: aminoglycoside phosphotransferase family protein [Eubacteriales bacterium]|nr:aminoglycoside phosphotransferase family protein [Eubacteriales bacterium]
MNSRKDICSKFNFVGEFISAEPYGGGHINDTYKVVYKDGNKENLYILQRINSNVFKNPEQVMENIGKVTAYLNKMEMDSQYEVMELIYTKDNQTFYREDGDFYRAFVFVKDAVSYDYSKDLETIFESGKAFGNFQKMLANFPLDELHETIPNFHHTYERYKTFCKSLEKDAHFRKDECLNEIKFALGHEDLTHLVVDEMEKGTVPVRVTHNDTKINNVLFDVNSGKGKCVIDLDTVMPGSALYDYGDSIRSSAATAIEDEPDLEKVWWDKDRFTAFTKGYLSEMAGALTEKEKELLPYAGILITYEIGLRFLTDYLDGDTYFKIHYPTHNLVRAKNQFKFVADMEKHIDEIKQIVKDCLA